MSTEEIFRYWHWTNSTSCRFAVDFGFTIYGAGGLLRRTATKPSASTIPSLPSTITVSSTRSFDESMEKYGCQVYSFDPSMGAKDHNRTEKIHFYNIGLSGVNGSHPTKGWNI
ncbi:hypothetical protein DAPPUDRAFT_266929 [Daphnia pulex]|uniref:Uncharacterized protein n=1 Tax=Daphnia pulex TaxID=6669 RepID=E9HVS4_DAPPU|nr:hypothetical protein DAPPUDRAFT_266929 [Daphnia pulex]|eukprot:EFX64157.1 hypothetical protein DAPPUDRAFT_266929 [Daphnia pulex]